MVSNIANPDVYYHPVVYGLDTSPHFRFSPGLLLTLAFLFFALKPNGDPAKSANFLDMFEMSAAGAVCGPLSNSI